MLFSVFMLALHSVLRNVLRSFLTILGIVIGVSAVITMVTLGNGATQAIHTQIASLGTNLLMVSPGQRVPGGGGGGGGVPQFTESDAAAIKSEIGGIAKVAPLGRASVTVVGNGRNWATTVTGSVNEWFDTGNWKPCGARSTAESSARQEWGSNCGSGSSPAASSASSQQKGKGGWATRTTPSYCRCTPFNGA